MINVIAAYKIVSETTHDNRNGTATVHTFQSSNIANVPVTVHRRLADDCSNNHKDLTKTGTDWCISLKTEHLLKCDYAALSRFCTRKPFSFKCDNAVPAALGLRPS